MQALSGDPGVFIRSMASRGSLGGLAHATAGLVQAFDAAGYPIIFIETVGAGQAEVDIARLAHTTLVVLSPPSQQVMVGLNVKASSISSRGTTRGCGS